jgi:hypothetical protein
MRLAAFTDDPQIRNQLIQQAHHWMAVAMPTLRATRGQHWPSFTQTSMLPDTPRAAGGSGSGGDGAGGLGGRGGFCGIAGSP